MAQIIPLKLVIELGGGSEFFDSVSDSDQDIVHPWPGDPVTLDLTCQPSIQPVWIGVSADGTDAQAYPLTTSVLDILAAGWVHVYQGTEIVDCDNNVNVYSDQYNHVLLAIAACCNANFQTQMLALKQGTQPLTPGTEYPCNTEAIFKWLSIYGRNEDRPDLSVRFDISITTADEATTLAGPISSMVFTDTLQLSKSWPSEFIGMTIDGVNLVANDQEVVMPGEMRVKDFDFGTITLTTNLLNAVFEVIQSDTNTWALPSTQCGAGCIDPYPDPLTIPDGTIGVAYNASIQLEGAAPFAAAVVQKPDWMTFSVDVNTGIITLGGTPDEFGNDAVLEFKAENCGEAIVAETPSSGEILFDVKQVLAFVARTSPGNQPWYKVVWANYLGLFVAISQSNASGQQVATSPDGEVWTLRNTPGNINWNAIAVNEGAGKIVAVGTGDVGAIMSSPDAINWTAHDAPEIVQARGLAYSPDLDLWVSVGSLGTNRIMKSADGETFTPVVAPVLNSWYGLVWSTELQLFVATAINGTNNQVMTSPDGDNWTVRATGGTSRAWFYVSNGGGLLVAVSGTGTFGQRIMTSPDAINWTIRTVSNFNGTWTSAAYGSGTQVIISNAVSGQPYEQSPDGQFWTSVAGPIAAYLGIAYNGTTRFAVVGQNVAATADWT